MQTFLFEIPLVNQEMIEKKLNELEDGTAVGLDGIPPKLLPLSASAKSQPLTYILNQLIKTTIFLDEWKTAKVVPLHKKDSTQLRENFGPISVLSTLSKLLERHIHTHFYRFLVDNNLLHIATWQKRASIPEQERILKVTLNDTQLDNVENEKLLGVYINNNLS